MRAIGGDVALWPLLTASLIALACAYKEIDRGTAMAAGFAVAWALGTALVAGHSVPSFGWGPAIALGALTVAFARAIARRGVFAGDPTVATIVVVIAVLLTIFIFYPVAKSLLAAVFDAQGRFAPQVAMQRLFTEDIWGLGCFGGGTRCGVAVNSAMLATIVGMLSTLLGLVFALVVQRGGRRYSGILKLMSILPIVTPPFVIALALVVLF